MDICGVDHHIDTVDDILNILWWGINNGDPIYDIEERLDI